MASGVIEVTSTDQNDQVKHRVKAELDSVAARLHMASSSRVRAWTEETGQEYLFRGGASYDQS